MAEYPNAVRSGLSPNRDRRTQDIKYGVVHHYAGTQDPESAWQRFNSDNDRSVSPNYQANADGSVFEVVPPRYWRAWTGGDVDQQAITVETQNTSGEPDWGISNASHEAIARIMAWAHLEFGIPLDRDHIFGDREVEEKTGIPTRSTACPGPSMRLDWIVERAKVLVGQITNPLKALEENNMTIVTCNGKAYAVELGKIGHVPDPEALDISVKVTSIIDELHKLTLKQFQEFLRGAQIPDGVLDANGYVKDPITGKHAHGNYWSKELQAIANK